MSQTFTWAAFAMRENEFFCDLAHRLAELKAASVEDENLAEVHAALFAAYNDARPHLDPFMTACEAVEMTEDPIDRLVAAWEVARFTAHGRPSTRFQRALQPHLLVLVSKMAQIPRSQIAPHTEYFEGLCAVLVSLDEPIDPTERNHADEGRSPLKHLLPLLGVGAVAASGGWMLRGQWKEIRQSLPAWAGGKAA